MHALYYTAKYHKRLMQIRHCADRHPVPYAQLRMRRAMMERGYIVESIVEDWNRLEIPVGYEVIYTNEEVLPGHVCRHISVAGPNELPAPQAVEFLMARLGFTTPMLMCKVWTLPVDLTDEGVRLAVNVVEPVSGDWDALKAAVDANLKEVPATGAEHQTPQPAGPRMLH